MFVPIIVVITAVEVILVIEVPVVAAPTEVVEMLPSLPYHHFMDPSGCPSQVFCLTRKVRLHMHHGFLPQICGLLLLHDPVHLVHI